MRIVRPPPSPCLQDNPAGQAPNVVVQPKAAFGWGENIDRVENRCRFPIEVAVQAVSDTGEPPGACTNYVSTGGSWCTRAWFPVGPGETTGSLIGTDNGVVYYYAHTTDPYMAAEWSGSTCETLEGNGCSQGSSNCYCFDQVKLQLHFKFLAWLDSGAIFFLLGRLQSGYRRHGRHRPLSKMHLRSPGVC